MLTRRDLFPLAFSSLIAAAAAMPARARDAADINAAIAAIETRNGGRLGVALLDTRDGMLAGHRIDERFPMCSTSKVLAVAETLARVDAGQEQLSRRIHIDAKDVLAYAPVTKTHLDSVGISVAELCEAAITVSDNTAANLLLASAPSPSRVMRSRSATTSPVSIGSNPISTRLHQAISGIRPRRPRWRERSPSSRQAMCSRRPRASC